MAHFTFYCSVTLTKSSCRK